MADQIHKPRNAMMWKVDPQIEAARRAPGWSAFHRECGKQWLYFDEIEREGRGYRALAYTATKVRDDFYQRYVVARGTGRGVLDAVLAAFDAAVAAGFSVDAAHRGLLDGSAVQFLPTPDLGEFADLIGEATNEISRLTGVTDAANLEDLIG